MKELNINGVTVQLDDEGYLTDSSQWNEDIAKALAKEDGIDLTDKHIEVLKFLRDVYNKGEALTIRKVGKSGIVDIKEFYKLFPKGPLKLSSKFAGLQKPSSCV
ncbi:MAG TPA: TusE/DsrC/DsvC family sulfur relay protein [Bacteroidetes bacterium]|nr:TusE/DsrC/DsvC family sulfur relay protein [Bacteroidota bacterium]